MHQILVDSIFPRRLGWVGFLQDAQAILSTKPPLAKLASIEVKLFALAAEHRVNGSDLVFCAVLALLYEKPAKFSYPQRLLKFYEKNFCSGVAYNVMADLLALELMLKLEHKSKAAFNLMTADVGLAMFWCAMDVDVRGESGSSRTLTYRFTENLLPALSLEQRLLLVDRCLKFNPRCRSA